MPQGLVIRKSMGLTAAATVALAAGATGLLNHQCALASAKAAWGNLAPALPFAVELASLGAQCPWSPSFPALPRDLARKMRWLCNVYGELFPCVRSSTEMPG